MTHLAAPKRIIVTGGSGMAGRHVVAHLVEQGYDVLNLDKTPLPAPLAEQVHTICIDLTDAGQVYSSMLSHFQLSEPLAATLPGPPDAVIHIAGMPRPMLVADPETFRINTMATYNVISAACKIGVKKIMTASSVCVYGLTYTEGEASWPEFPVTEETVCQPTDEYSISKACCEEIARGFARRYSADIYCMRLSHIVSPERFDKVFSDYVSKPLLWKPHGWSYTDARDMGQMFRRGLETNGLGFQAFNALNDEMTNDMDPYELVKAASPSTPIVAPLEKGKALLSNAKMKKLLGFREQFSWRVQRQTRAGQANGV